MDQMRDSLLGDHVVEHGSIPPPQWLKRYLAGVKRNRVFIVSFWFVLMVVCMPIGVQFLTMGDDRMLPPPGSRAKFALDSFNERFPIKSQAIPTLVLMESLVEGRPVTQPELSTFSRNLTDRVLEYNKTHYNVFGIDSWFSLNGTVLDQVKVGYANVDQTATFMNIQTTAKNISARRYDFINWLEDVVVELNPNPSLYDIGVTGFDAMAAQNTAETQAQVEKIDIITMPIAFLLLAFMVRSWRLLAIGMINMGTAILGGFAIMVVMVKCGAPHPETATSQLMEVMALAMSIDYSLFLCRRFRDECKDWRQTKPCETPMDQSDDVSERYESDAYVEEMVDVAVERVMHHAGHVVLMSGATILVVFVGFCMLPVRSLVMDGISCSIAISLCLLVNLTNTPAMLYTFPRFFSTFNGLRGRICSDEHRYLQVAPEPLLEENLQNGDGGAPAIADVHPMYKGMRFRITKKITAWPYNVIVILALYVCVIPFATQIYRIDINQDILGAVSRHADASMRLKRMYTKFPGGTFSPFYVQINIPNYRKGVIGKVGNSASHRVFKASQEIAKRIVEDTACDETNIITPTFLNGTEIQPLVADGLLFTANHFCKPASKSKVCQEAKAFQYVWEQSVNTRKTTLLITIMVPFFPFAPRSATFIDRVHKILDDVADEYYTLDQDEVLEFHLNGFEVAFDEVTRSVYRIFPILIGVTCVLVFIVLGVLLKSYFVPIRLAATVVLPLVGVFGLAVLVYQDGILEWTGLECFGKSSGFFWYIPVLIVTMVLGLALDYDCFLIVRIMEHRSEGYDIQAAITKACCETGGTITSAGIIMTLAFGGMLISDQTTVNQCGWLLMTAVLLDTFVVNTILVPALMSLGDNVAWAPTKMPRTNLKTLRNPEFPQH